MSAKQLGDMIRARRLALGYTQEELEARSGIGQASLSDLENGKGREPRESTLQALADALDLSLTDLKVAAGKTIIIKEVVPSEDVIDVRVIGVVPADTVRFTAVGEEGRTVTDVPKAWVSAARYPVFAVEVSGDCLAQRKIRDGFTVICEEYHEQHIANDKIVLVRIGDEYTLKIWWRAAEDRVELRNGAGEVVHVLDGTNEFTILGVVLASFLATKH